ncbi:nicotinate-nucleotide adenylyltransferase [Gemmatimonadota bacterium]
MPSLRLGLFGGTFDPPHVGHLVVAQDAIDQLDLDRLLFVPARLPPHKSEEELSPAPIRLEMTRAAVNGDPLLGVSEVELGRGGPSFTVDTLKYFRGEFPEAEILFLMGADQLREIHQWRDFKALPRLCRLVAMTRDGLDPEELRPSVDVDFHRIQVTRVDLSSTGIRARVREGRSIRHLVPSPVREIIERNHLYWEGESPG